APGRVRRDPRGAGRLAHDPGRAPPDRGDLVATAQLGDHRGDRRGGPFRACGRGGTPQFLDDAATLVDDPGSYLGAPDINPDRQAHAGILPEIPAAGVHPRPMPPVRPGLPPPARRSPQPPPARRGPAPDTSRPRRVLVSARQGPL